MKPPGLGTLFDFLAQRGRRTTVHLSRPFDIAPWGGVGYDVPALAELVEEASGWLAAAGARPGDRVALLKANHWDVVLLACAAARLGAVPALISDHLPGPALQTLLTRLDPGVLVTDGRTLTAARGTGTDLTAFATRTVALDARVPGALMLDDVRGHPAPPVRERAVDETLVIHHTSGTTGVPKLVEHPARTTIRRLAHLECVRVPVLASRRSDTVACADPFTHGRAVPWTVSVFHLQPRKVVILADHEPTVVERTLAAHPPTTVEAAPASYVRWRRLATPNGTGEGDAAGGDAGGREGVFRNVRLFVSTFDAVHPPVVRRFLLASRRRRPVWVQGWGQTEVGPLTFRLLTRRALADSGGRHPTTRDLGRPVPGRTRLRVVDPVTLRPLRRGRPGLVLARTRARCDGYLGEPERFANKVDGPWWNTGDLGVRTRTGRLVLLDREVDTVPGASGIELEDVIEDRVPEVLECTVLGTPGHGLLPVLVTVDGGLDLTRWREAVADLPALAEPVTLPWEDLPRTGTGKVRRLELRRMLLPGLPPDDGSLYGTGRWT